MIGLGEDCFLQNWSRRKFLKALAGSAFIVSGGTILEGCTLLARPEETFIAKVANYESDIASVILAALHELKVTAEEIKGKRILLKPNLVEPHAGAGHINTHPLVVRGAIEAFMHCGAAQVIVAEGTGHCRDSLLALEESGLLEVLKEDRIPFADLNYDIGYKTPNLGGFTKLPCFTFPSTLRKVDWIVSMPKLKTHHWAGVTLSMKNLFGLLPGIYYGWPKNVLHIAGIKESIIDINATVKPHFAIVDGIVGMEGDGPIMGTPKFAGVLVMGRNLPAVDATCARIMDINPHKIDYLAVAAAKRLGAIRESRILQRGETVSSVSTNFELLNKIHAHHGIRNS